ncbi:MAG: DEAD/DEAH box helicase family protein, partial [Christensenellaceae bacterium]|nr:DEAD/DEAH box helicase family protein [Christensenellaceae bacterium]
RVFEILIAWYFKANPIYSSDIKHIWLWSNFPYKKELTVGGRDDGIDIVILTTCDEYWAVQCKFYGEDIYICKDLVTSFLSLSNSTFNANGKVAKFTNRFWVSTSDNMSKNAENILIKQTLPVTRITKNNLEDSDVNWELFHDLLEKQEFPSIANFDAQIARPNVLELRDYQREAINNALNHYKTNDRGKLIMACGTGKTLTSLKIAEALATKNKLVLVCVPSISLISQTLRQWALNTESKVLNKLCVCSHPEVTKMTSSSDNDDVLSMNLIDLGYPATTDAKSLYEKYSHFNKDYITAIFTTYQSIDVLHEAQELGLPEFDIVICDEAHRTTGSKKLDKEDALFTKVHYNKNIKARLRLYMTATPRLYNLEAKNDAKLKDIILCSMDDPKIYGKEIYKISFRTAVEKGCLSPYRLMILMIDEDSNEIKAIREKYDDLIRENPGEKDSLDNQYKTAAKLAGCINALSKKLYDKDTDVIFDDDDAAPMRKAVAYCQKIIISKATVDNFNSTSEAYLKFKNDRDDIEKLIRIECDHIDGSMSSVTRDQKLVWLNNNNKERKPTRCRILSNVRCLSEGIDVPALDAIIFLSSKKSKIEIVQSVGRVMRKAEDKKNGYIIIPIIMRKSDGSPENFIEKSDGFDVIWEVLSALQAHDEMIDVLIMQLKEIKDKIAKPKDDLVTIVSPSKLRTYKQLDFSDPEILDAFSYYKDHIMARLVNSVNPKLYWYNWAKNIAVLANEYIDMLTRHSESDECKNLFDNFIKRIKEVTNNPNLKKPEIIEMLAQHKITEPVFNALFSNYKFTSENPISKELNKFLSDISKFVDLKEIGDLQYFYDSVKRNAQGATTKAAKQQAIVDLYNNFFEIAFPKTAKDLGIVYTPIEIVDFIINSVSDILKDEFDRTLSDEGVNILDPFTGTGTFITRLLQSGLIKLEDIERKYCHEVFANEIVLLAYYIGAINIETTYHEIVNADNYKKFNGLCLTDTFMFNTIAKKGDIIDSENAERIYEHSKKPITVVISNPPYSVHGSSDSNFVKIKYKELDDKIKDTYIAKSDSTLVKSMYDSYIRAFRSMTDRIGNNDGIICFVSNGAWLKSSSNSGLRKCFEEEFSKIYILDLRGDARTRGELNRKEGAPVFIDGG